MKRLAPILLAALVLVGCRAASGPNVVLITLDTTRADRIGVMGDATAKTPNLDRLASHGVLFERAYASAPLTLPSHTTMLTGLDPNHHGIHDNGRFIVPASVETVTERLHERGYRTGAFVTALVLSSSFGLAQGFETYDDDTESSWNPLVFAVPRRTGGEATDRALAWLEQGNGRAPFFLWVHYYDAHLPRHAPPPFDQIKDPYAGAISYLDAEVARLLAAVEKSARGRETLTVVVADHGESLGEHDEVTHGMVAYDATLHVPLIVAGPGFPAGTRSKAFVHTADLAPTILAAVGAPPFDRSDGVALQSSIAAGDSSVRASYFETRVPTYSFGWAGIGGIREGRWKLTLEPEPFELYDVAADPREKTNRIAEEADVVARLRSAYEQIRPEVTNRVDRPLEVEDAAEKLAALGYVSAPQTFEPGTAPDPRKVVGILGWLDAARMVAVEGRVADSIQALEIFARESPVTRPIALRSLGPLYQLTQQTDRAVEAFRDLADITGTIDSRIDLADVLVDAGRPDEALAILDELARSDRTTTRHRLVRAQALLAADRADEAASEAESALEADPKNDGLRAVASRARAARDGAGAEAPRLQAFLENAAGSERMVQSRLALAAILHSLSRDVEAIAVLEGSKQQPPEVKVLLADIAAERGNLEKAAKLYEEALKVRMAALRFGFKLASLYRKLGRDADALALYDRMLGMNPNDATMYVDRGTTLQRAKRLPEAEKDYRRALAIDANLPEAAVNLALLLIGKGDAKDREAEALLEKAIDIRPDYAKAHFHLARLYGRRGDPRAAAHSEKAALASSKAVRSGSPREAAAAKPSPEGAKP